MPPAAPDIRDIKPLVSVASVLPMVVLGVATLVLLLVVAAAWWWWWRRRRPRSERVPEHIADPPALVARRALDALRADLYAGAIPIQHYFFELSAVLRGYVEACLGINATDLTTAEIRNRLTAATVAPARRAEIVTLLDRADAVKFARADATVDDCDAAYREARHLLEVIPVPEPSTAVANQSEAVGS